MGLQGKRVLVVDDEDELRKIVKLEFEMEDCLVFEASTGLEAHEWLKQNSVDFIVSDIRMPDMDGVELLTKVREKNPKIPFVFLITGFSDHTKEGLMKLGANEVFQKPVDLAMLIKKVSSVIE